MGRKVFKFLEPGDKDVSGDNVAVSRLLLEWQERGDGPSFEALFNSIRGDIQQTARSVLKTLRIHSDAAVDEVVSLVMDHVRRLSPDFREARDVSPFNPNRVKRNSLDHSADSGRAYIRWLSHRRALDVARSVIRRDRKEAPFTSLPPATLSQLCHRRTATSPDADDFSERLRTMNAAISALDGRARQVLGLLLDGYSQAEIAKRLSIHEGTVSRIRAKAIDRVRQLVWGDDEQSLRPPAH